MPVPAKRRSRSKARRNRAHQALVKPKFVPCKNCGKPSIPHRACAECGFYQGRLAVVTKTAKTVAKTTKAKAKKTKTSK